MSGPSQRETPEGAPPAAAAARSVPTTVDYQTHPIGIVILSHAPPKGIGVSVDKEYFRSASNFADLPARLTGRVDAWVRKEHGRLRFTWEADASNTLENLGELLREEYSPALELGDNGRLPRAKGATWRAAYAQAIAHPRYARFRSAADQEEGGGGEQIKVKYREGTRELEQIWTKQVPTFVSEDWAGVDRKLKPRLNVPSGDRNTLEKMLFNVGISLDFAGKVAGWMNQRLPGGKGPVVEKTTVGEVVRLWGYMGALAKNPGLPVKRMWQDAPRAGDLMPPPNMRSHGMVKNRFNKLVELHGLMFNLDEGDLDQNDPWRYARAPVDAFNDHMRKVFVPGELSYPVVPVRSYFLLTTVPSQVGVSSATRR